MTQFINKDSLKLFVFKAQTLYDFIHTYIVPTKYR